MKLYYIANNQLPTPKAHGLQIMKMCEAFSSLGIECELIYPDRRVYPSITERDPLKYYRIKTPFTVTKLPTSDFITVTTYKPLAKFLFWLQQIAFGFTVRRYLIGKRGVIYSRDPFALFMLRSLAMPLFWELHTIPKNLNTFFYKKVLTSVRGIISISRGLQSELSKYYAGPSLVAHDGVDLALFSLALSKADARQQLQLPQDRKIALYAGHLYVWKGIDTILGAAEKDPGVLFVLVGGTPEDMENYKKRAVNAKNVLFVGFVDHVYVPTFLAAADVLLLPNSGKESISREYTSPLKLFEYLASGTPIVASDLPSLREILTDELAILVEPDDPQALARGIQQALVTGSSLANRAQEVVRKYTWQKRASNIANFIKDSYIS